jgi:hypothetical protein
VYDLLRALAFLATGQVQGSLAFLVRSRAVCTPRQQQRYNRSVLPLYRCVQRSERRVWADRVDARTRLRQQLHGFGMTGARRNPECAPAISVLKIQPSGATLLEQGGERLYIAVRSSCLELSCK